MAVKFDLPLTQHSTAVAFVATLLIAIAFTVKLEPDLGEVGMLGGFLRLLHLGTFSTWLGVQVWVVFFAGLTMYRHLPRHTFGYIQGKLFPKFFLLGSVLSSVTLVTYLVQNPFHLWKWQQMVQGCSLLLSLLLTAANMLYFEPQTTKCAMTKHKFEKEVSAGQAPGKVEEDKIEGLRKLPEYVVLEKRFIWLHTYSTLATLIGLGAQAIHLWHLSCCLSAI